MTTPNAMQLTRRLQMLNTSGVYTVPVYYTVGYLDPGTGVYTIGSVERLYTYPHNPNTFVSSPSTAPTVAITGGGTTKHSWAITYGTAYAYPLSVLPAAETMIGQSTVVNSVGPTDFDGTHYASLSSVPVSPNAAVTQRFVYRAPWSVGPPSLQQAFALVGTIADNTTTTFTDTNASPGRANPTVNTTAERIADGYPNAVQAASLYEGLALTPGFGNGTGGGSDAMYGGDPT